MTTTIPKVWVPDRSWRVLEDGDERLCRMSLGNPLRRCTNAAVAELNRGKWSSKLGGKRDSWWAYCADHLYGRRIEGGQVLIQVTEASAAAERGYVA